MLISMNFQPRLKQLERFDEDRHRRKLKMTEQIVVARLE
ncbi:MAG: hypothetical protein ACI81G_001676 [Gammaproteobacteria bacterium]